MAISTYPRRAGLLVAVAVAASVLGCYLPGLRASTTSPEPVAVAVLIGFFSFGPAALVGAATHPSTRLVWPSAGVLAVLAVYQWQQYYAGLASSTNAFDFLWGWYLGLPATAAIASVSFGVDRLTSSRRRAPTGTTDQTDTSTGTKVDKSAVSV
jgi:hypothetical protein